MSKKRIKSAFEYKHVKGTTAWALLYAEDYAGKIVCNQTDNPNGNYVIMDVRIWGGPMNDWTDETITARDGGGCGWDKFSGAFHFALRMMKKAPDNLPNLRGKGERAVQQFLEELGYTVLKVV